MTNRPNKPLLMLLSGMLLTVAYSHAHHDAVTEYEVKAAFIHNIARFVEWPGGTADKPNVVRFCIVGEDHFGRSTEMLHETPAGGEKWQVVRPGGDADLRACRVLFIAASESVRLEKILNGIKGSAVLTIGDTAGYARRGVMVNFYLEAQYVRFEINENAVKESGIVISSRLLRLARIVGNR